MNFTVTFKKQKNLTLLKEATESVILQATIDIVFRVPCVTVDSGSGLESGPSNTLETNNQQVNVMFTILYF